MQTTNQDTEQMIVQGGANAAPRVTPADVDFNIVDEFYFTAREGCEGACGGGGTYPVGLGLLTLCVLVLRNGFTVTGESACASPENFNAEIGRKIARADAFKKIWPLMGYALREQMAHGAWIKCTVENLMD